MLSYSNPVVRGTAPDPSVIRVGNDFYLATSTFDHWPGIQIRHSTDLVNWRIIGAAVTRPSQYRRDGQPGAMMLYAPTLRYAQGRFYLACTNFVEGQGNFIVSAEDPAGEWSDAVWLDNEAFDPSLLYDDGTWYYTRRTLSPLPDGRLGPVVQAELDIDTGKLGSMRELTQHWSGFCSNDIEGPHLYHIGEWYYLFSAEGGSWKGHMQTCGRSRSPWGPFEPAPHNPVLTHRHRVGHPIQTVGHAELLDAPDGSWWALFLGTRHDGFAAHHNLGRETFLAPVVWQDGWPVIGDGGTTELNVSLERPLPAGTGDRRHAAPQTLWSDGWSTLHLPDPMLDHEASEYVKLPFGADLTSTGIERPVGALLLPQRDDSQEFSVVLEGVDAGGCAGVAVFADSRHFYEATISQGDSDSVVVFHRVIDDLTTTERVPLKQDGPITLTITATSESYAFSYSVSNGAPVAIGKGSARLLSAETAEAFVGVRFGLISVHTGEAGYAQFSRPRIDGAKVGAP